MLVAVTERASPPSIEERRGDGSAPRALGFRSERSVGRIEAAWVGAAIGLVAGGVAMGVAHLLAGIARPTGLAGHHGRADGDRRHTGVAQELGDPDVRPERQGRARRWDLPRPRRGRHRARHLVDPAPAGRDRGSRSIRNDRRVRSARAPERHPVQRRPRDRGIPCRDGRGPPPPANAVPPRAAPERRRPARVRSASVPGGR